ncbi:MAG: FtsX-like permease family protein, partial [Bryobacterales bacterium]|nr:FtsX-like permease family protein [Bryobacterales bacterium]
VNESFARHFFNGENPVGKTYETMRGRDQRIPVTIVGLVRNARYDSMREVIRPTVYVPSKSLDHEGVVRDREWGQLVVRTESANPMQLASILRQAVPEARTELRVSNVRTQEELVRSQTTRERMLAMLSLFFAVVALLLAGVGLYGVLDYSVVQLRRDIGIRLALGAQPDKIVRRVATEVFSMLLLGSVIGLMMGIGSERYLETLLYQVKPTDLAMLILPIGTILGAALLAAVPPLIRALRIDPAAMLRSE